MYKKNDLDKMCLHLSNMEKLAQKASRDSVKYKQCEFLLNKIGVIYPGVVVSIQDNGMFIEIPENGCVGYCRIDDITNNPNNISEWVSDVNKYCVYDKNFGHKIRVGDQVMVSIKEVDLERREISLYVI